MPSRRSRLPSVRRRQISIAAMPVRSARWAACSSTSVAQHIGDRFERARRRPASRSASRAENFATSRAAVAGRRAQQIAPVIAAAGSSRAALDDAQAVLVRARRSRDDLRVEQPHRVGGDRVAEARMELLGHRRAADDVRSLQHHDLAARPRPDRPRRSARCGPPPMMATSYSRSPCAVCAAIRRDWQCGVDR